MIPLLFTGLLVVAAAVDRPSSSRSSYGREAVRRGGALKDPPDPLTDVIVHIDPTTFTRILGSRNGGEPVEIYYAPNADAAGYAVVGLFPGTWRFEAELLHGKRVASSPEVFYPGDRIRLEESMDVLLARAV